MNYASLNKTQRTCIDAFVELDSSLYDSPSISRKKVEELWKTLYDNRASGGPKIGYPMWLVKGKKVSRGEYEFPAPGLTAAMSSVVQQKIMSEDDKEFFEELANAGVLEEVV